MKKHIPNAITCLNLLSGCIGLVYAFDNQLITAGYFILISALFDFFDGMLARLLKAYSEIGKELDSLADMVSFGVLPSVMVYQLFRIAAPEQAYLPFFAFLIAIFSALRLAKFNIDTRQTENFIGLPTPANALFILSLPHIVSSETLAEYILNPVILAIITLVMSLLLVAELPLFSLKFKNLKFSANLFRFILLGLSVILLIILKFAAIPLVILSYLILSFIQNSLQSK
jgi:CDP-diacylglycerol--serine O-phosphatidyltransferase